MNESSSSHEYVLLTKLLSRPRVPFSEPRSPITIKGYNKIHVRVHININITIRHIHKYYQKQVNKVKLKLKFGSPYTYSVIKLKYKIINKQSSKKLKLFDDNYNSCHKIKT